MLFVRMSGRISLVRVSCSPSISFILAVFCKIYFTESPCLEGYTKKVGPVNQQNITLRPHTNKIMEQCDKICKDELEGVSFEYCHYKYDDFYGVIKENNVPVPL